MCCIFSYITYIGARNYIFIYFFNDIGHKKGINDKNSIIISPNVVPLRELMTTNRVISLVLVRHPGNALVV